MHYVYFLKCNDGKVYTGFTSNLNKRIEKHQAGLIEFTSSRLPVTLVTYIAIKEKYKAYYLEKYFKSGVTFPFIELGINVHYSFS